MALGTSGYDFPIRGRWGRGGGSCFQFPYFPHSNRPERAFRARLSAAAASWPTERGSAPDASDRMPSDLALSLRP